MSVRLVTDSTAYLPRDLLDRHGITVAPLNVSFDGQSTPENEIDLDRFYERLAAADTLPTSSQPSTGVLRDAFEEGVKNGDAVLGVFLSAEMSGTLRGAEQARDLVLADRPEARIELVDSRSNCMQLGFTVLQAARSVEEGASLEEAAQAARETIPRSRFLFTPATLEYLRRGGRIGSASALIGSALKIRPILSVADGQTVALARVRTQKRAVEQMLGLLEADAEASGLEELVAHHIGDEKEGRRLADALSERWDRDVPLIPVGPVIGLHVGPGAVGFVHRTRKPLPE